MRSATRDSSAFRPSPRARFAVGVISRAYQAEVFRASYLAISRGELEAAVSVGMNGALMFRRIIARQVLRFALPGLGYISVMPNAVVSGATLLERYRDASRKEAGNQRLDVLHETTRPNRFVILEVWKDEAGFVSHDKAASTLHFRDELEKIQIAARDERVSRGIYGRPVKGGDRPGTIYVLTHVDVFPRYKVTAWHCSTQSSIDTSHDDGNIGCDVLPEADHPNHFTVIEEWTTRNSRDAHLMATHARISRKALAYGRRAV